MIVQKADLPFTFRMLGQVGVRFTLGEKVFYIDPYLSNSVAEIEDPSLKRLIPIPEDPSTIKDADFILITHDHRDHCDLDTLLPILDASPHCKIITSPYVYAMIGDDVKPDRYLCIANSPVQIDDITITPVPSAHPDVTSSPKGGWEATGYVIESKGMRLYHPGDTFVHEEIISKLKAFNGIDHAFLPVNEHNFYREHNNILGNMTIREAFQFAEDIGVKTLIPTHWDMFECNQVFPEEIQLLYDKISPSFKLQLLKATTSEC